jgi:ABC-type multidrug transport system ATPase subunit
MRITIDGVTKSFGHLKALEDVSLGIEPGQIVALLGPNGAGKTTMLRMLSGILSPDKGQVFYDDETFNRGRMDLRRRLFFLPDTPAAYATMTPVKHAGMVFRLYRFDGEGIEEEVTRVFRDLDILPHANIPLSCLSRGQVYKTVLTPLLVCSPELWLLDEPFASGMDPNGLIAFKRYAREARDAGRTIIYSTQILEVNEGFCDRVCVIHKGRIEAYATMDELKQRVGSGDDALSELFQQLREERE